ncbi:MAG: hypothetical protein AB7F19_02945 [Candidatus Babeliales bacterium]
MHSLLLLAIILPLSCFCSTVQPPTLTQAPTIIIHTSADAVSHLANVNKLHVIQESHSTNIQHLFAQARDTSQEYAYGILSWVNQHKIKTACYGALLGYGYIWYKLASLNYALMQATNWSKWRETLSLEELLAKPQQEIAKDLLTAIQKQYTTPEQFDDLLSPLIAFVRDVDTELQELRQLVHLHTWIDRLHIAFLFPKQSSLLAQAHDNINRLTYLKNVLLNWMSQHKVARLNSVTTPLL